MNIVAQCIGLLGFLAFVSSIQAKEKKKVMLFQLIANLLYGVSYFLLSVKSAFLMSLVSAIRCAILFFTKKEKPLKIFLFLLLAMIVIITVFTYDGPLSLIPAMITAMYTISTWQNNMTIIRYAFIAAGLLWIFYNFNVGAYVIIIGNTFEVISGIVSLKRFQKKPDKKTMQNN